MIKKTKKQKSVSAAASWGEWFERSAKHYRDPRMKMAYYAHGRPDPMKVIRAIHRDVWQKLKATKNSTLLDVGTGVGLFLDSFQSRLKYMAGTDISFSMLRNAHKLNPKGAFLQSEASSLPFAAKSFDRVLCYSVFHYLRNHSAAIKVMNEFARITKNGGLIFIGDVLSPQAPRSAAKAGTNSSRWWPPALAHNLDKQKFNPKFFKEYCRKQGYQCQILKQNIPGKPTAESRYDVVIKVTT